MTISKIYQLLNELYWLREERLMENSSQSEVPVGYKVILDSAACPACGKINEGGQSYESINGFFLTGCTVGEEIGTTIPCECGCRLKRTFRVVAV
jgi:hypothetical protein